MLRVSHSKEGSWREGEPRMQGNVITEELINLGNNAIVLLWLWSASTKQKAFITFAPSAACWLHKSSVSQCPRPAQDLRLTLVPLCKHFGLEQEGIFWNQLPDCPVLMYLDLEHLILHRLHFIALRLEKPLRSCSPTITTRPTVCRGWRCTDSCCWWLFACRVMGSPTAQTAAGAGALAVQVCSHSVPSLLMQTWPWIPPGCPGTPPASHAGMQWLHSPTLIKSEGGGDRRECLLGPTEVLKCRCWLFSVIRTDLGVADWSRWLHWAVCFLFQAATWVEDFLLLVLLELGISMSEYFARDILVKNKVTPNTAEVG